MMSEVGHLAVLLSALAQNMPTLATWLLFLAIHIFTFYYLVVMHLFPLYIPGIR